MITLIQDAATTGESDAISIVSGSNAGQEVHSFQVTTLGSPEEVTVSILGTLDGVKYSCIASHILTTEEITNGSAIFHLINKPVPKIKAVVNRILGGATPTVSVYYFKGNVAT